MEPGSNGWTHTALSAALIAAFLPLGALAQSTVTVADPLAPPDRFTFATVANMADLVPDGSGKTFNSFNQPSVNASGLVVLRGRSKGPNTPVRGIYSRQMGDSPGSLTKVFDNRTTVPQPNNADYNGSLATFTEFPAFPRIGAESDTITTRAQSRPVWEYTLPDGSDTRAGTSGIYARRLGEGVSAMTQLGAAPGFSHYSVPGAAATTRFDQFPGAPAVSGWNTVAFKGNYTDGTSKTGIFFRSFSPGAPFAMTRVIASSDTLIPGGKGARFGSTAPPSASDTDVVFLGLDNEESPTLGAIYQAALVSNPPLKTLVKIGGQVPGEPKIKFERLGEALSYDGRFVAFWGGWGGMRDVTVRCPGDGQAEVIAYCRDNSPNKDGVYVVQVPINQGFFVHNAQTGKTYPVARTGAVYEDFLYWTFSGRPPGVGDSESEDFEPPRWRSAAFAATWSRANKAQVAFKGRKAGPVDGIYITAVGPSLSPAIRTVAETGWPGNLVDPMAHQLPITALGIERDGLRNGWLAIAASMSDGVSNQAGVYVTRTLK